LTKSTLSVFYITIVHYHYQTNKNRLLFKTIHSNKFIFLAKVENRLYLYLHCAVMFLRMRNITWRFPCY